MLPYHACLGYTIVNPLLALIIFFRSRRNTLSKFYFFCVFTLSTLGALGYSLMNPLPGMPVRVMEQASAFLYAVFPFFFLHFMLVFIRRYEILRSSATIMATYAAGIFSYILVLMGLIPNPFVTGPATSAFIYYLTWMSILFCIGVALLYSLVSGFAERGIRSNLLFLAFVLLMLLLPTPFTQTVFSLFSDETAVIMYYTTSLAALAVLVYVVFRHRIMMNTPYQAMKSALQAMNDVLIKTDTQLQIEMVQGAITPLLGHTEHELIGQNLRKVLENHGHIDLLEDAVKRGDMSGISCMTQAVTRDGRKLQMDFSFTPILANEELAGFVCVGRDVTEKMRLEEQLRQAQKMEILGLLAGGVAHDFNNLLTIVLNSMSLMERFQSDPEKSARCMDAVRSAVDRGAGMTKQLLTFARRSDVAFAPLDPNIAIRDVLRIVDPTFPKSISIETNLSPKLPFISADLNQLSQALLNLLVNARDAVLDQQEIAGRHGVLRIESLLVEHARLRTHFADTEGGPFVEIIVSDNGTGMDEQTRHRIFEPFFTTKGKGKGTGLGLAVVYGVVKSHRGLIDVQSARGEGTSFHLYFPVSPATAEAKEETSQTERHRVSGASILIVDDEEALVESLRALLAAEGYTVFAAHDGEAGVAAFKQHRRDIHLVLLDEDLPRMNGLQVLTRLIEIDPDVDVLCVSGSVDEDMKALMIKAGARGFIFKPFSPEQMFARIQDILTSRA